MVRVGGLAGALAIGLAVGGGIGAAVVAATTDPTQSEQYTALQGELDTSRTQVSASEERAQAAAADVQRVEGAVAKRGAKLDQLEKDLGTRTAAVTAVEQQIAANSIGEGTWTVGRDVEPGTYRTSAAVTGQCYWGIYRSGSNGSDIIDNDIVNGGFPDRAAQRGTGLHQQRMRHFREAVSCPAATRRSEVLAGTAGRAQWVQSYVTDDALTCVYLADSAFAVGEHAECGGFPSPRSAGRIGDRPDDGRAGLTGHARSSTSRSRAAKASGSPCWPYSPPMNPP